MLKNMLFALHYAKLFYIMLCTIVHKSKSTCSSAQQARRSACFAEIHIWAFKRHCRGASASQDRSLKGKGKGRELQALKITLFQYRKGEGERERERGGGGREREMRMRGSLGEVLSDQGTKLRGGRAQTSDQSPVYPPGARPPIETYLDPYILLEEWTLEECKQLFY